MRPDKLFIPQNLTLSAQRILDTINCELEMVSEGCEDIVEPFDFVEVTLKHPNFTDNLCQLLVNAWYIMEDNGLWVCDGDNECMAEEYQLLLIKLFVYPEMEMNEYVAQLYNLLK